jgi:hypothetical protein
MQGVFSLECHRTRSRPVPVDVCDIQYLGDQRRQVLQLVEALQRRHGQRQEDHLADAACLNVDVDILRIR